MNRFTPTPTQRNQTELGKGPYLHDGELINANHSLAAQLDTPELYRRHIDHLNTIAEIVQRSDGGPMRPIGHGRQHKPVGIYYSVKSGRGLAWESRNELHDMWRAEVRADVVRSRVQPHTLSWTIDGQTLRYTPDREDILDGGRIQIIEVKNTYQAEKDPYYAAKLDFARSVYEGLGWAFHIHEKSEIEAQPQFDAIRTIQGYRRTAITTADLSTIRSLFSHSTHLKLKELQNSLPPEPRSFAAICAMVVHRILAIDLNRGLGPDTIVSFTSDWG